MDRNERVDDPVNALIQAQGGLQQKIWTALPGIAQSFDSEKMTAEVQPAVKAQLRDPDTGKWNDVTLPLCLDCPVVFPFGKSGGMTFPVAKDDEGLLVFASRCVDSWWQSGGVQTQAEFRMHDLSDGFFLPGCFSQPRKLASFNADFPEFRNTDGTIKIAMNETGFRVFGTFQCEDLRMSGSLLAADGTEYVGDISTLGDVKSGTGPTRVTLRGHQHPGNNTPPTPGH